MEKFEISELEEEEKLQRQKIEKKKKKKTISKNYKKSNRPTDVSSVS